MEPTELDIGDATPAPRPRPRRAALDALEHLLRAHVALSEHRRPEGAYGLLRPAREDEIDLIGAVFQHCGVPLPATLRAIYRRTLGVGNPVSAAPVLAVPFLRGSLPDEGFGCRVVGLATSEEGLGNLLDGEPSERPPFLALGHAAPLVLAAGRSGLWSLQGCHAPSEAQEFGLPFEAAFRTLADQAILLWANDLAGDLVRPRDLDLTRGARLDAMPAAVREARAHLVAPRTLGPKVWGDVQPLDNADLLRASRRRDGMIAEGVLGGHVTVVGLPYGDRPELTSRIGPGSVLRLRPVDDNPHDPNAVEVWHDGATPVRVGFVTRAEAPGVRALPQGPGAWRLRVAARSERAIHATLETARLEGDGVDAEPTDGAAGPDLFSSGA